MSLKSIKVIALILFCMCSALADAQEFHFRKGEEYRRIGWDESAFREYVKGMKIGEAASALNVAHCYLDEYGTPRNIAKGEQILDAWAKKDLTICEYAISYYYDDAYDCEKYYNRRTPTIYPLSHNYSKAFKFMNIYKSKTGEAHHLLGDYYLNGYGVVPIDTLKAIDFAISRNESSIGNYTKQTAGILREYIENSKTQERLDLLEQKYPELIKEDFFLKTFFGFKRTEIYIANSNGIDEFKKGLAKSLSYGGDEDMKRLYKYASTDEQKKLIDATRTAIEFGGSVRDGYYSVDFWDHVPRRINSSWLKEQDYYTEDLLTTEDKNKYDFLNDYLLKKFDLKYSSQCASLIECITYDIYKRIMEKWDEEFMVDVSSLKKYYDKDDPSRLMIESTNFGSIIGRYIRDLRYKFKLDSEDKLPYAEKYFKLAVNHVDSLVNHYWGETILVTEIIRGEERGFVKVSNIFKDRDFLKKSRSYITEIESRFFITENMGGEERGFVEGDIYYNDLELKESGYKTYAEPSLYKRFIEKYPHSEWYQYAVNNLPFAEEHQKDLDAYERAIKVTSDTPKEEIKEIKNIAVSEYMKKRVSNIIKAFKKGKRTIRQRDVIFPMPGSVYDKLNYSYSNDSDAMTPAVH